jgi:hypothetical protein
MNAPDPITPPDGVAVSGGSARMNWGGPTTDEVLLGDLKAVLRDLIATIELHTDCMDGRIDRHALDPYIERAEDLLGESLEEIIE